MAHAPPLTAPGQPVVVYLVSSTPRCPVTSRGRWMVSSQACTSGRSTTTTTGVVAGGGCRRRPRARHDRTALDSCGRGRSSQTDHRARKDVIITTPCQRPGRHDPELPRRRRFRRGAGRDGRQVQGQGGAGGHRVDGGLLPSDVSRGIDLLLDQPQPPQRRDLAAKRSIPRALAAPDRLAPRSPCELVALGAFIGLCEAGRERREVFRMAESGGGLRCTVPWLGKPSSTPAGACRDHLPPQVRQRPGDSRCCRCGEPLTLPAW